MTDQRLSDTSRAVRSKERDDFGFANHSELHVRKTPERPSPTEGAHMRMTRSLRRQSGFTLLELMVVVAIIAIIAGIVLVNYTKPRGNAQAAASEATMKEVATAMELYYQDNQSYPTSGAVNAALFGANARRYMQAAPTSPGPKGGTYTYTLSADATSYTITDPATYPSSTLSQLTAASAAPANGAVTLGNTACAQTCSNLGYSNQAGQFAFGSANGN